MSYSVKSILETGNDGLLIDVECHTSNGLPGITIIGFANKAIDEAKERTRSAFASCKLDLPRKRIVINLAPADIPKDGTSFDLAIATAILLAAEQIKPDGTHNALFLGELGLDGTIRPVRGIIGKLLHAKAKGINIFYIPEQNYAQANLVPGIELIVVPSLKDLYLDLSNTRPLPHRHSTGTLPNNPTLAPLSDIDFSDVVGQARAKRALEIAAAGMHNVMMNGSPGAGKSMLAKALPGILPKLNLSEVLEITHIHSLAGRNYEQIITQRPFRAPHHSASSTSVIGGGTSPRPGEISLAHNGVLLFDEFPEFGRSIVEALRQPLEDGIITVARARNTVTFPAQFVLVTTSNPCPCGYFGSSKTCRCTAHEIQRYQKKISGPIIDRIDLYVDVDEVSHNKLLRDTATETSQTIQKRVNQARLVQSERFKATQKTNAQLTNRDIKRYAMLEPNTETLLNTAAEKLGLSARSYMRTIKVARTIADLDESKTIQSEHMSEALQYRKPAPTI